MGRYRVSKTYRFSYLILLFVILIAIVFFAFNRQVSKHMGEICEYKGRNTAAEIVTNAIADEMKKETADYINISRDDSGKITSVETNSTAVNDLQNRLTSSINSELSKMSSKQVSVALGSLSGVAFFSGRGPDINLKLRQVGAVDTKIKSEFVSAGVNQTKHRMIISVTVEMSAILPLHSTDVKFTNDYLLSETVIVGEVPSVYLSGQNVDSQK